MKELNVFIIAGEASGDIIGANLMRELKSLHKDSIKFAGVGGLMMKREGLQSIFDMNEISLIGFAEIIPNLLSIMRNIRLVVECVLHNQYDVIITIDSPGFNFRVVDKLRKLQYKAKFVHYVAPTVWAYKKERAKRVAALYDHIMLILPFEKQYFDEVGMPNTFVGHPVVERVFATPTKAFLQKIQYTKNKLYVVIMPGSRESEVNRLMPIFTKAMVKMDDQKCVFLILTMPHLACSIKLHQGIDCVIITDKAEREMAMSIATAAITKSGTSTVELMAQMVPMVVCYKVHWLTAMYLKHSMYVRYVTICNILLNKQVVPELLQYDCIDEKIAAALVNILKDNNVTKQKLGFKEAMMMLQNKACIKPSQIAASVIISLIMKQ